MRVDTPKISTSLIIGATIVFFPVAFVLILIRFAAHAKVNHFRAKDYRVTGHVFLTLFLMAVLINVLVGATASDFTVSTAVTVIVVFAITLGIPAAIFYIVAYKRNKKMEELYSEYYSLIMFDNIRTLEGLSQRTGISLNEVKQDISYMIASQELPDALLDSATGTILVSEQSDEWDEEALDEDYSEGEEEDSVSRTVTCTGCGATSTVSPSESRECEFCGNVLAV
ncbi:hypothetical protein [Cohnella panacarvi]|uniref:hypothetical protein n=1 Tax=Cohnella panacarvi TaxID=400776 RepID=UPI0004793AFF|nr:hypothetical protein [Cohnella panacarvi]